MQTEGFAAQTIMSHGPKAATWFSHVVAAVPPHAALGLAAIKRIVRIVARIEGDIILMAPWLLHRHEKLWQNPNAFIPARFMPPAAPPDRFAYLPFGVGARVCIGTHFALVEATLALAKMIGAFRVTLLDRDPVTPIGVVTTQPDRSPMFGIERR